MAFGLAVTYLVVAVLVTAGLVVYMKRRDRWTSTWDSRLVVSTIGASWPVALFLLALFFVWELRKYLAAGIRHDLGEQ
jgi:O-antigen/teichoic acid export membrane protein